MTDKEVNKIIAEFMGEPETISVNCGDYSKDKLRYMTSLDAIVPVLVKIGQGFPSLILSSLGSLAASGYEKDEIPQAVARVTAKAILELK